MARGEQVMQVKKEPVKSRGFLLDVALNAVEPGFNRSVLLVLNIAFVLLLLTLLAVTFLTGLNLHVIFLGVLALGLQIAFNWFIMQLPPSTGQGNQQPPQRHKEE